MEITSITESDLPALANLYQQLIPNEVSVSKMKIIFNKHKSNPNHIVLAAKMNGKLVGSILAIICEMLFGQCKSFMVIEDVIVDKTQRRSGIGFALMQYIEYYARKNNCSYIMLITDANRIGSQEFYKALGYKTDEYRAFKKQL